MNEFKIGDEVWVNGAYYKGYGIVSELNNNRIDLIKIQSICVYTKYWNPHILPFMVISKSKLTLKTI